MRLSVDRKTLSEAPYILWNAFISLLAETSYDELSPLQRPAYLVFWYESEVQNGGHLQYFENQGMERTRETLAALDALGASQYRDIFERARDRWASRALRPVESAEEYTSTAIEGEFDDLDTAFHQAVPDLKELLQGHLAENTDEFVEILDDY